MATHYHRLYVRPNWASVFTKKAKIACIVFYQDHQRRLELSRDDAADRFPARSSWSSRLRAVYLRG